MSLRATAARDFSTTLARSRRLRSKYDLCQASLHEGRTNPSRRLPLMKTARFWQDSPKFVRIRELGERETNCSTPVFSRQCLRKASCRQSGDCPHATYLIYLADAI